MWYHSGKSGLENNSNEGVAHVPQNPSITGNSPSNYLVSYAGNLSEKSYRNAVGVFYSPS